MTTRRTGKGFCLFFEGEKRESKPTTFTELAYFLCISFIDMKTSWLFQSCATSFAKLRCADLKYILRRRGRISRAKRERGAEAPAHRCPTGRRDADREQRSSFSTAREEEAETPTAHPLNSQQRKERDTQRPGAAEPQEGLTYHENPP